MAFALRRSNLTCFYCGIKSAQKRKAGAQQWRCSACEAVNYLDKNGQIADPPASSTPIASNLVRFARSVPGPTTQETSFPANIFCSTCLKNQHLLKETLSSYLPPEDNPNFSKYAASYEAYRDDLERRYPQVCPQCAPRVREQIRKATYVAKTDHLRRMMARTKQHGVVDVTSHRWAVLFLRFVGLVSISSALFQAAWHAIIALSLATNRQHPFQSSNRDLPLGESNILEQTRWQHFSEQAINLNTLYNFGDWIPMALLVSLLTIWWHPCMPTQYSNPRRKSQGLIEFYLCQVMLLVARIAAFYYFERQQPRLSNDNLRGAHIFMAVIIASGTFISTKAVKLNPESRFVFPAADDSLLADIPEPASENSYTPIQQKTPRTNSNFPFQISQLTSNPSSVLQNPNPPTPPPDDEYDPDSMDWSPSIKPPQNFNPAQRVQPQPSQFQGPSPFHGTLPPAPMGPSHRLRNPAAYNPTTFQKATDTQQSHFASSFGPQTRRSKRLANKLDGGHDSDGTEITTDNEDDTASVASSAIFSGKKKKHDLNMANPSFFPAQDQRDTGLEDLFSGSFDLQDTPKLTSSKFAPPETANAQSTFQTPKQSNVQSNRRSGNMPDTDSPEDSQLPASGRMRLLTMAVPAAATAIGLAVWSAAAG